MSNTQTPSVETPLWLEQYNKRIQLFADATGIAVETVQEKLTELGVDGKTPECLEYLDNEEDLTQLDLFKKFVDTNLAPIVKVRRGARLLRGQTKPSAPVAETTGNGVDTLAAIKEFAKINRPKSEWTDEELLNHLEEGASDVIKILYDRTHGRPCIVLKADGTVDVPSSIGLIRLAKKQATQTTHMIDGRLVTVRRVGEWLPKMIEESPVAKNVALVDGFCAATKTNWKGVPQETRVLAHIFMYYCHKGQLDAMSIKKLNRDAQPRNDLQRGIEIFREEYPEAALVYDDLQSRDELPKLKLNPNRPTKDTGF